MRNDKTIAKPQVSEEAAEVSGWFDMFPETAEQSVSATPDESPLPFSEWCVVPIAVLIIVGDMLYQFFG